MLMGIKLRAHQKLSNIRKDFCHKTSRTLIDDHKTKVIILEDLNTATMTRKPKPIKDMKGCWKKNKSQQKSRLNKSILDKGWHQLEGYLIYKAHRKGKVVFKVSAYHTSQECADCGHTHPNNRKNQELFL